MFALRRFANHGLRSARRQARLVLTALLAFAGPAGAQTHQVIRLDYGDNFPDRLSFLYPPLAYRSLDDQSVRPGGDALGMGGAYLARAEGPIAVGWEPAGLAALDRPSIAVDAYGLSSSSAASGYPAQYAPTGGRDTLNVTSYSAKMKGALRTGFLSAAAPIWRSGGTKIVGAFSWRRYIDLAVPEEVVGNLAVPYQTNVIPVVVSQDRSEKGAIESFAPSIAIQVIPELAVGANLNFLTGRLTSDLDQEISYGGAPQTSSFTARYKFSGFVPDFGGRLRLLQDRVLLAARYSPAYIVKVRNGTFSFENAPIPTADGGSTQIVGSGKIISYDLKSPAVFDIGAAIRPIDRLTVAFDLNHHAWSKTTFQYTQESDRYAYFGSSAKSAFPLEDVSSIHVGAEFVLVRRPWGDIPIRAGFHTNPQSSLDVSRQDIYKAFYHDASGDPESTLVATSSWNGTQAKPTAVSFGASVRMGAVSYDLGVESYTVKTNRWFFDSVSAADFDQWPIVQVKQSLTRFRLSASYVF